ncbi:MAG: LLM class flavin-dependent oxidoreductase [Candidatus Limnocylindrales bacterium]
MTESMHGEPERLGLKIGVTLGSIGVDAAWWLESARRLEDAGYDGVWCWDHFVGRGDRTVPVLEQWTTLAAAAAVTSRIGLGTHVTNVMNRHPAVLARTASTVQAISSGRLTLGIGIGGHPAEHRAYGIDFPSPGERAARMEEAIAVIRALWTGGPVTLPGPYYPLEDAVAHPAPSPRPRILVGASSITGVRLAARAADGWIPDARDFDRLVGPYRDALAEVGRSVKDVHIVVGFGSGRSGQDALTDSPWITSRAETAARWAAEGADEVAITARTTADVNRLVAAAAR